MPYVLFIISFTVIEMKATSVTESLVLSHLNYGMSSCLGHFSTFIQYKRLKRMQNKAVQLAET